jgi:hypothetical protein
MKIGIEDPIYGAMNHAVSDCGFVDMPGLRVVDIKGFVFIVFVGLDF